MILLAYALHSAAASATPPVRTASSGAMITTMTIQQRLIIRIPASGPALRLPRPVRWKEKRGPNCVALSTLSGAAITEPDSVDLFVRGGARMRALLDRSCPALDYYSGFYLVPTRDGQVCSGRDTLKTRAGGECGIDKFRVVVLKR